MEQVVAVARKLRVEHEFKGYIHLKTIPEAMDSPAEPVVCEMLFSRIEVLPSARKIEMESTAIGIEAETVRPVRSAR